MFDNDKLRATIKSILLLAPLIIVCLPVWYVVSVMIQRSQPGVLMIHCPPPGCKNVTVSKESAPVINSSSASAKEIEVTPISHGPYLVHFTLPDNTQAWVSYFHLDAGERKRVDLYIEHLPDGKVKVRANGYADNSLIEEIVGDPKGSTEEKPIQVSWP